jgi:hypothetical protein
MSTIYSKEITIRATRSCPTWIKLVQDLYALYQIVKIRDKRLKVKDLKT